MSRKMSTGASQWDCNYIQSWPCDEKWKEYKLMKRPNQFTHLWGDFQETVELRFKIS